MKNGINASLNGFGEKTGFFEQIISSEMILIVIKNCLK